MYSYNIGYRRVNLFPNHTNCHMDFFRNIFQNDQPRNHSPMTASSNNSTIRSKWAPWRRRPRRSRVLGIDDSHLIGLSRISNSDTCPVCASDSETIYALRKCHHQACLYCWRSFVAAQVGSFAMAHLTCVACDNPLPPSLILSLLKPLDAASPIPPNPDLPMAPIMDLLDKTSMNDRLYQRYEDFLLYQCLSKDKHARWCPRGCGYAVLAYGFKDCPQLTCHRPECNGATFCYRCRGPWTPVVDSSDLETGGKHVCFLSGPAGGGLNVESFLGRLRQFFQLPSSVVANAPVDGQVLQSGNYGTMGVANSPVHSPEPVTIAAGFIQQLSTGSSHSIGRTIPVNDPNSEQSLKEASLRIREVEVDFANENISLPGDEIGEVKACPHCKTYLLKLNDGSCNHMSCFICGCEFCWLCLREVRGTHYLSPSGCTFWGREQWPFRWRIYVMLLAALATPFGLALLVPIGILSIIVAFPIYSAINVSQSTSHSNSSRRRCKAILTFMGSLLLSPILAGLAVFLGVPLILIYVYVFMPITMFSARSSSAQPPNSPIQSDIGHTIDWNHVAERTNQHSRIRTEPQSDLEALVHEQHPTTALPVASAVPAVEESQGSFFDCF